MVGGRPGVKHATHTLRGNANKACTHKFPRLTRDTSEAGDPVDNVGDKADKGKRATPPWSEGRKGSKAAEADQMEHLLSGGQWEGLGAICKGGEICVEVSMSW